MGDDDLHALSKDYSQQAFDQSETDKKWKEKILRLGFVPWICEF